MAAKRAVGADGREWTVQREWLKRMPRWRRPPRSKQPDGYGVADAAGDLAGGCMPDDLGVLVLVVVGLLALWFFVIPALVFIADLLVLLIIAAIGIAIRVLFRRPWSVIAETDGPPAERVVTPVVGYRASGQMVDELAYRIERSGSPLAP